MSTLSQILWGTGLLGWCTLVHVAVVSLSIPAMRRVAGVHFLVGKARLRRSAVLLTVVFALLVGHTIQIWSWALTFIWFGFFEGMGQSFYFTMVTYTTLGYGDITLGPGERLFATFASVAGLFNFGISTAFLFGVLGKILPDVFSGDL